MSTTVHGPDGATPPPAAPPEPAQEPQPEPAPEPEPTPVVADPPPPTADDELFDGKGFERTKPNVDGEDTDTAKVTITGSWDIDLEDPAQVEWFNRIARGQSVDLQVEAECTDRIAPYKRNAETDEATVTGVMKLKVTHAHRLTPEELG